MLYLAYSDSVIILPLLTPTHPTPARTSQQHSSFRINQHQPSATSQPNRLLICVTNHFKLRL
jgi:hypothetical protein